MSATLQSYPQDQASMLIKYFQRKSDTTNKDLAHLWGVSGVSVSRKLNEKQKINSIEYEKIEALIKDKGFDAILNIDPQDIADIPSIQPVAGRPRSVSVAQRRARISALLNNGKNTSEIAEIMGMEDNMYVLNRDIAFIHNGNSY